MLKLLKNIALLILLFCATFSFAGVKITADRYARFLSLDTKNGLCNNKVLDIKQDSLGFIWFATVDGLSRYDGYRFVNFKHNPKDSTTISDNYIQTLAVDANGILWVGTKNGLNIYDHQSGTFKTWKNCANVDCKLSNEYIRKILPDDNNVMWIETVDGVLNKINTKTGEVHYYPHHPVIQEYYSYHCLFKDSDGDLWVGNRGRGPYCFNPDEEKFHLIKADPKRSDKKRDQEVAYVYEDSKQRFWVGATDGFWRFYKNTQTYERIIPMSSRHLIEDQEGTLWLSGTDGLYRYNADTGATILYTSDENDPHSIINNSVRAIYEDRDGDIWAGTDEGISYFSKSANQIKYIRRFPEDENSLASNNLSSVLEDNKGNIWFGTKNQGLSKWNIKEDKITNFKHKKNSPNGIASDKISCLYQDKQNNIWVGLWQGVGFNKYNPELNTFKKYAYSPNSKKTDWYNAFIEDNNGQFYTGLWGGNGVHLFDRKKEKFLPYDFHRFAAPAQYPIHFIADDDSCLWTARNNGIIYKLNKKTNNYTAYTNKQTAAVQNGFQTGVLKREFKYFDYSRFVKKTKTSGVLFATSNGLIAVDSTKNNFNQILTGVDVHTFLEMPDSDSIWLGCANGLGIYSKTKGFQLIENSSLPTSPLFEKKILTINFLENRLLIGTDAGLHFFDIQKNTFYQYGETLSGIAKVNAIVAYNSNAVYVATDENLQQIVFLENTFTTDTILSGKIINCIISSHKGCIYVGTNKGIVSISENCKIKSTLSLSDFNVYDLKEDKDGIIWAGTDRGIFSYSPIKDILTAHNKPTLRALTSHLVSFLETDFDGNIWVGTTNMGVNRINPETLEVKHFFSTLNDSNQFWGSDATVFFQQKNGTIWIGGQGLNKYNPTSQTFSHITTADGFPTNKIFSIQEDSFGNLWVGTEKGLVFYKPQTNLFERINNIAGLYDFDFSGGSLQLSSGELLFSGKRGAILFNPNAHYQKELKPQITITGVKLFGEYRDYFCSKSIPIEFNYDENFFTIEFSPMQAANVTNNFLYRLEGIDKQWVKAYENNSANYTNVPPGNYILKVKMEAVPTAISEYRIIIHPPFYRTWWFIITLTILNVSLVVYVVSNIIRKQKVEQQRVVLEHKLLQLQMDPHFIFNVLTAIQSFIYRKDVYESGLYLSKFARLMRIFLQNSRNEWISMSTEIESLKYYLSLQQLRKEEKFTFNIDWVNLSALDYVYIPPMLIQPFVENCIEHGLIQKHSNGEINISFELKEKWLEAIVTDNGVGYNPNKEGNKNKTNHKSMAFDIIQKRLEIANTKKSKYGFEINRITGQDGKSEGTKVKIRLPYKEEF